MIIVINIENDTYFTNIYIKESNNPYTRGIKLTRAVATGVAGAATMVAKKCNADVGPLSSRRRSDIAPDNRNPVVEVVPIRTERVRKRTEAVRKRCKHGVRLQQAESVICPCVRAIFFTVADGIVSLIAP